MSILAFYSALPFVGQFRLFIRWLFAVVILTTIICTLLISLRCMPPKLIWHFELAEEAKTKCLSESAAIYASSGISLTTDLLLLTLPIKTISGTQIINGAILIETDVRANIRQKMALSFLLCLGFV
jgi:hypothetical protein